MGDGDGVVEEGGEVGGSDGKSGITAAATECRPHAGEDYTAGVSAPGKMRLWAKKVGDNGGRHGVSAPRGRGLYRWGVGPGEGAALGEEGRG